MEQLACIMEVLDLPPEELVIHATRRRLFFGESNSSSGIWSRELVFVRLFTVTARVRGLHIVGIRGLKPILKGRGGGVSSFSETISRLRKLRKQSSSSGCEAALFHL